MIKNSFLSALIFICILSVVACADKPAQETVAADPGTAQPAPAGMTGAVLETMDAGNYTYVRVNTGSEEIWAAAPTFAVKVDDEVTVPEGMAMQNFHSDTLDRDFPMIYFVGSITKAGDGASIPSTMPNTMPNTMPSTMPSMMPADHPAASEGAAVDTSDLKKVKGTTSIGDLYAKPADFKGKELTIHGKVVKINVGIMGKNWIHLVDGSGDAAAGTNDLTITTDAVAAIGNTVTVKGMVTLDKDFGAGYRYAIIIEDAQVTIE